MKRLFTTLILMVLLVLPIASQSLEKFSIDSGGVSTTVNGTQILYTIGEVTVQEISTATFSISEGFINPSYDASLGITDNQLSDSEITVYPNPTKHYINISTNITLTKIELFDVLGRSVFQSTSVSNPIDVSTFTAGVYILKLYKNIKPITKRIVIE